MRLSTLSTALSGAVTCAVHVSAAHLVVASTGDCQVTCSYSQSFLVSL